MGKQSEKSPFDGPRFYFIPCTSCDGGRVPRRGWFTELRESFFGRPKQVCVACRGSGEIALVHNRDNTLIHANRWELTEDGMVWVITYRHFGRKMTWREIDEAMCPDPLDLDAGSEVLDHELDARNQDGNPKKGSSRGAPEDDVVILRPPDPK